MLSSSELQRSERYTHRTAPKRDIKLLGQIRTGLKSEAHFRKALFSQLPDGFMLGKAYDRGDCFFDALAQHLNEINHTDVNTAKYLRVLCRDFYLGSEANKTLVDEWNAGEYAGRDGGDEYLMVQYTVQDCDRDFHGRSPIWGRPGIEGIILCHALKLEGIGVIEILEDPETEQPIMSFHLADKDHYKSISEEAVQQWFESPAIPVIVVEQNSLHFVPLLKARTHAPTLKETSQDNQFSIEPYQIEEGSTGYRVMINDAGFTEEQRLPLNALLKDERFGIGSFHHIEGSEAYDEKGFIKAIAFSDKRAAEDLAIGLGNEIKRMALVRPTRRVISPESAYHAEATATTNINNVNAQYAHFGDYYDLRTTKNESYVESKEQRAQRIKRTSDILSESEWHVPEATVDYFVPRDDVIEKLDNLFHPSAAEGRISRSSRSRRVLLTALHGLGGIGKTQLAIDYLLKQQEEENYTFYAWFNARDLANEYRQFAIDLGVILPGEDIDKDSLCRAVIERHLSLPVNDS